ncbi:hypothetical protein AB6A40_000227 [Gnathostoma spinigerum]|uniref:Uncharacterized protein n=1 Tax=Gnathostoma spinigerum TaxID=75299 RepID=A0ABD6E1R9_9BILA
MSSHSSTHSSTLSSALSSTQSSTRSSSRSLRRSSRYPLIIRSRCPSISFLTYSSSFSLLFCIILLSFVSYTTGEHSQLLCDGEKATSCSSGFCYDSIDMTVQHSGHSGCATNECSSVGCSIKDGKILICCCTARNCNGNLAALYQGYKQLYSKEKTNKFPREWLEKLGKQWTRSRRNLKVTVLKADTSGNITELENIQPKQTQDEGTNKTDSLRNRISGMIFKVESTQPKPSRPTIDLPEVETQSNVTAETIKSEDKKSDFDEREEIKITSVSDESTTLPGNEADGVTVVTSKGTEEPPTSHYDTVTVSVLSDVNQTTQVTSDSPSTGMMMLSTPEISKGHDEEGTEKVENPLVTEESLGLNTEMFVSTSQLDGAITERPQLAGGNATKLEVLRNVSVSMSKEKASHEIEVHPTFDRSQPEVSTPPLDVEHTTEVTNEMLHSTEAKVIHEGDIETEVRPSEEEPHKSTETSDLIILQKTAEEKHGKELEQESKVGEDRASTAAAVTTTFVNTLVHIDGVETSEETVTGETTTKESHTLLVPVTDKTSQTQQALEDTKPTEEQRSSQLDELSTTDIPKTSDGSLTEETTSSTLLYVGNTTEKGQSSDGGGIELTATTTTAAVIDYEAKRPSEGASVGPEKTQNETVDHIKELHHATTEQSYETSEASVRSGSDGPKYSTNGTQSLLQTPIISERPSTESSTHNATTATVVVPGTQFVAPTHATTHSDIGSSTQPETTSEIADHSAKVTTTQTIVKDEGHPIVSDSAEEQKHHDKYEEQHKTDEENTIGSTTVRVTSPTDIDASHRFPTIEERQRGKTVTAPISSTRTTSKKSETSKKFEHTNIVKNEGPLDSSKRTETTYQSNLPWWIVIFLGALTAFIICAIVYKIMQHRRKSEHAVLPSSKQETVPLKTAGEHSEPAQKV